MTKILQLNIFIIWFLIFILILLLSSNLFHPVFMIILLILFNLLTCLNLSFWKQNFIFSLILFLIIIRGLLILFIYFSRLISNEQINLFFNLKFFIFIFLNISSSFYFIFLNKIFLFSQFYHLNLEINNLNFFNFNTFSNLIYLYIYPFRNITLLRIFFILWSFLTIIKINISSHYFSIRKIKY